MIFSKGSSQPRDQTSVSYVSCIGNQVLYHQHLGSPVGHLWGATKMFSPTTTGATRGGAKEDGQEVRERELQMNNSLQLLYSLWLLELNQASLMPSRMGEQGEDHFKNIKVVITLIIILHRYQCFSNSNVQTKHVETLLKCRLYIYTMQMQDGV